MDHTYTGNPLIKIEIILPVTPGWMYLQRDQHFCSRRHQNMSEFFTVLVETY